MALARTSVLLALGFVTSCDSSLPDAESPAARLYVRECGLCHVAYPPRLLRPAMWEMQMGRMDLLRRQRGLPPLSAADSNTILEYLTEHSS